MKSLPVRRIYRLAVAALALAGALWSIVAVGFAAQAWWRLPDLSAWHRIALDSEFRAGNDGAAATFAAYLEQEARLFVELKQRIYDDPGQASRQPYDRYAAGSPVARLALESAGNRSGVTEAHAARGAVVLLHGLTDAPYSLHAVGRALHERGLHVVTLRLPGHGTTPGALTRVSWHDWDAAVLLAVRHAAALAGGKPLYVAGYSTGAPLALLHALRAIDDPAVPMPTRLFLFSPAIGVSEFAVMSEFAGTLAFLPGLQKASWLDVLPEYDPFKYNSFPVNGARQSSLLTRALQPRIARLAREGRLADLPPILTFQSATDFTVSTSAIVTALYAHLPANGSELVLYDLNRHTKFGPLLRPGKETLVERLLPDAPRHYRTTVVSNAGTGSYDVTERIIEAGATAESVRPLGLRYPNDVFSLSHVALPFPEDDPVYGGAPDPAEDFGVQLGAMALRGERGTLVVSLDALGRTSWNPFFPYQLQRIEEGIPAAP